MTAEEQSQVINFCSGRSRLPASATDFPMSFKLTAPPPRSKARPDDYLPIAQTCFFSLSIPEYTNLEVTLVLCVCVCVCVCVHAHVCACACVCMCVCVVAVVYTLPPFLPFSFPFPFNPSNISCHAIALTAYNIPSFTSLNNSTLHLQSPRSQLTSILLYSANLFSPIIFS